MTTQQMRVVAAARGWLGTRFHHQGRLKKSKTHKGGVDCLGLLVGVADELGLCMPDGRPLSQFDETNYSHWPDSARLKSMLASVLTPIPLGGISVGDIVLLSIDHHPQHLAIISDLPDGLGLIHAYAPARAVVEHPLDDWWQQRIASIYRINALPS